MPINFPNSPSLNQTYTYNNSSWVWNGVSWESLGSILIGGTGSQGITGPQGNTGTIDFYYQENNPLGITYGSRWMDSDTGIEYVYVNDGSSDQWIQPISTGTNGATGSQGIQGVTGATGPVGDYVISVNGQTGAVEYIADFKRGWFLS